MNTFRVEIAGDWSAEDFASFFSSIAYVYSLFAVISIEREGEKDIDPYLSDYPWLYPYGPLPGRARRRLARLFVRAQRGSAPLSDSEFLKNPSVALTPEEHLRVKRCEYASPGGIDLAGIGQTVGHVKDFILKMVELRTTARERQLKDQILEQDLKAAALRNLREEIAVLKDLGYSEAEVRKIVTASRPAVEALVNLTERKQITYASELEDHDG
jgi:hypothetical protein